MGNSKSKSGPDLEQQYLTAARAGNTREVKKCLHKVHINTADIYGTTALHKAACHGHTDCMGLLMKHGLDPNAKDANSHTALHVAASRGQLQSVCMLLDYAADPDVQDVWGRTAIHRAIINRHYECAEILIKYGCILPDEQKRTPLHAAASYGHTRLVKLILGEGANKNYQDNRGRTPLYLAVLAQHNGVARALVNSNCDINLPNYKGHTPLVLASQKGFSDLVQLLLDGGANINFKSKNPNHDNTSAITFAILRSFGKLKKADEYMLIVRLLIQANGRTPDTQLFWQAYRGLKAEPTEDKLDLIHLLLKAGCAPDRLLQEKHKSPCDTHVSGLMSQYLDSVLPLKELSRRRVRVEVQTGYTNIFKAAAKLPLPRRLREYVLYKE